MSGWIKCSDRLPEVGVTVLVYTPPQPNDWPDDVRIEFDALDPDADEPRWMAHGDHYEHFMAVGGLGMCGPDVSVTGPDGKSTEERSMQINQQKTVQVDVTELRLHIKVRDGFAAGLQDAQGDEVGSYEGYVPDFFPGDHYGDYLILNIDLETGQIKNWNKPTAADIEKMLSQGEDD